MFPKGYRAREQAALERSRKRLVSPEIRAARAAVLEGKPLSAQPAPEPEKEAEKAPEAEAAAKPRAARK